jgi:hypothetical protein
MVTQVYLPGRILYKKKNVVDSLYHIKGLLGGEKMKKQKLDKIIKLLYAAGYEETPRQYRGALESIPEELKGPSRQTTALTGIHSHRTEGRKP